MNNEQNVQGSDTTMMHKDPMLVTKKDSKQPPPGLIAAGGVGKILLVDHFHPLPIHTCINCIVIHSSCKRTRHKIPAKV